MKIIGRAYEQGELKHFYESGKPEFITITGRRRVGKTFLIREFFKDDISFHFSGLLGENVTNKYQLSVFDKAIEAQGGKQQSSSKCWNDAFQKLQGLLSSETKRRKVIFIDELPWLDMPKSDFLSALDYFWNTFASSRPDIMLIVCGSATSWMVKNLFENKGGLHNRVTGRLHLAPFTLGECEEFFKEQKIVVNRYQIAEIYMVFGGIPFYLNLFKRHLGPTQNIDQLLFAKNAPLKNEFNEVYHSLFRSPNRHLSIVTELSKRKTGLTRDDIIKATKIPGGGNLTNTLRELEQCNFIEKYSDFTKHKKDSYYRLVDPFSLFCLKYLNHNDTKDEYYWTNSMDDGARRAWSGYAFEMVCLHHISQIKYKLGISGISTQVFSWRSKNHSPSTQIDLLISRKDGVINLCEMKFTLHPYTITAKYAQELLQRERIFRAETASRSSLHTTMITTYGLEKKGHWTAVQSEVTLDDLFV